MAIHDAGSETLPQVTWFILHFFKLVIICRISFFILIMATGILNEMT